MPKEIVRPEYKNRARPNTHTEASIDRSVLSKFVLALLEEIESLERIPPKMDDGIGYSGVRTGYTLNDGESIRLTERQLNLATITAQGYEKAKYKMFYMAGYSIYNVFTKKGNWNSVKQIKQELTTNYDRNFVENVQKMTNHLRYNGAVELQLDAKWLLAEQVDLYGECRRKNLHTQAVRLLHDISYHIDIDARVSNKLEITESVDYAKLLQDAEARVIDITPSVDALAELKHDIETKSIQSQ